MSSPSSASALQSRSRRSRRLPTISSTASGNTTARIAHHWASNTITYNITGLNAAEQFLAQSALQAWHEVANITFVQTSGAANITFNHNGTMQAYDQRQPGPARAQSRPRPSTSAPTGSPTTAAPTTARPASTATATRPTSTKSDMRSVSATRARTMAAHRIRPMRPMPTTPGNIPIMSYFAENNYSGSSYRYVVTPQMADIYAVDSIYGAATSTRTGDTVYGFNSNAGAVFNFAAYSPAPALTIYDSGGNDTLDCSGYSAAQTIDLHAGRVFVGRRPRQQYRDRAQRDHRESDRRQRQRHADRERYRLHAVGRRRQRYADRRRRQRQADRRLRRRQSDRRRRRRHVRVPARRQLGRERPA